MAERTVLVVEDDEDVRGFVMDLLSDAGYAVLAAHDARQGLSLAQEHEPAVVLIDHVLPDSSGLDLLERLHRPTHAAHPGRDGQRGKLARARGLRAPTPRRPDRDKTVRHRRAADARR